jgi:hypothetical protein
MEHCKNCEYENQNPAHNPCRCCIHRKEKVPERDNFKPKHPEVLTELQMWKKYVKETGSTAVFTYGKLMHQNGRLERDLELRRALEELELRIGKLEERIGEFIFECIQRKVSSNWLHKEMTKFKQLLEKEGQCPKT